jgi:hypothetical protein
MNKWLLPLPKNKAKGRCQYQLPEALTWQHIKNHRQDCFFIVIILGLLIYTIVTRVYTFRNTVGIDGNTCWEIIIARGSGIG